MIIMFEDNRLRPTLLRRAFCFFSSTCANIFLVESERPVHSKERPMRITSNGFSLLELVVVVAIIAILAALVIPNVTSEIQDAKQTGTMHNIQEIAKVCVRYAALNDEAPAAGLQEGLLSPEGEFVATLRKNSLPNCPTKDNWGNPLLVYSGNAVAGYLGLPTEEAKATDILIISNGRYNQPDSFRYDPAKPEAGKYKVKKDADYANDLINLNGNWIRGPEK
jgi:prepilin-type N-terminal cleavage/methylation domain-containing protein